MTPPNISDHSRNESKFGHTVRSTSKTRSAPSKSSRSQSDVFARLTQGLPTRHTAPPTNEHGFSKRRGSSGGMKCRSDSKAHRTTTASPSKHPATVPRIASQSLLGHSDSDPQNKISRTSQYEKETHSWTLSSQLLLPSPPRDFISCIPEPPYEVTQSDRSDYKSYLQHLRDLIDEKSEKIDSTRCLSYSLVDQLLSNDTSADSELTNTSSPIHFRTNDYGLSGEQLFQTEVSIVEDSESRRFLSSTPS